MTTRDPNHPGDDPTPGGDQAPGDEQTLAERVMQGDGLEGDGLEGDGLEGDGLETDGSESPGKDRPESVDPAFSAAADGGPQGPDAPGGEGPGEPTEADTETNVLPAVDPEDDRGAAEEPAEGPAEDSADAARLDRQQGSGAEPTPVIPEDEAATERTAVIPEDASATEQTRVIAPDESTTEETRVIPPQESAADERGVERTAVLPAQAETADDEARRSTRTDHAEDDAPRPRSTAAGAATAGGASGAAAAGAAATDGEPDHDAKPAKPAKPPRTTDRPLGAFALLVLRIITAGIFGVHGVQKLLDIPGTREFFGSFPLPQAELFGLLTAAGELAIALGLLLGLAVRIAGLGAMIVAVGALVLVHWTEWPIAGAPAGFAGELELLLAAVGFVFLLLGGGRIGLDRLFRRNP